MSGYGFFDDKTYFILMDVNMVIIRDKHRQYNPNILMELLFNTILSILFGVPLGFNLGTEDEIKLWMNIMIGDGFFD